MIMTVVYISEDSTPADTPTPATISPTSPREIIPIPTLNAFVLSFKNMIEGSPHPATFVPTAMAITIPERNNTLRFTPRKSTCAPIMAKKSGPKMINSFPAYSSTCLMRRVLATAIPTENAPTIGDSPTNAAIPAAPKNEAVTIPSMLPFDFHSLSTWSNLGIKNTDPMSSAANSPNI